MIHIPHPSLQEIIVSTELLFMLWPLRFLQRKLELDAMKWRRQIISHHVKGKHTKPLKACHEDSCALLTDVLPADHF